MFTTRGHRRVFILVSFCLASAGRVAQAQSPESPSTACAQLEVIQSRAAGAPEPPDILVILERAAAEVTTGGAPHCAPRVAAAFINHGLHGRAAEVAQVVAGRHPGMPGSRCVHGIARLAQIQHEASAFAGAAPFACERLPGWTDALADATGQCVLLGERDVTRAALATLRDVAYVCRDTGSLVAAFGALVVDIPPAERAPDVALLLSLLRRRALPRPLTDAALVAHLREWLSRDAPETDTVTTLHDRARDLLPRLRPGESPSVPVHEASLLTARALLAASGRLAGRGPGGYGRQIADLELTADAGLLEQPVVSEAAATMPLWQAAGAALSSSSLARVRALRERLRAYTAPSMCLVRFRLALSAGVRDPSQPPCERGRALLDATTELLGCDGACALPVARYARELHAAADEGLAAARECATGAATGDEFERIADALDRGECPRAASVGFYGATTVPRGTPSPGGAP
jgi:hypothetical protein